MKIKFLFFIALLLMACNADYTPKPKAFIKFKFPDKVYENLDADCPFYFEVPVYSKLDKKENSCLMDLAFPKQKGILYISYFSLDNNLESHIQQSRKLAYKHNVMVDAIREQQYVNDSLKVYGMLYDYEGISATATQFYLTDSVHHFFRGALYFNTEVSDSILPINLFLKYDIKHLIETFHWKDK
tara:strand:- start:44 stop:598 length:555 start_codon:yes stop_codon:yes gene_type:complete